MSETVQPRLREPNKADPTRRRSLDRKRLLHVLLPLFIGSVIAYLDRVNLAYVGLAGSLLAAGLLMLTLRQSSRQRSCAVSIESKPPMDTDGHR